MLHGLHFMVLPGDCGDYDPCDDGVYLNITPGTDQAHAVQTQAAYERGTDQRKTSPKTVNIPSNILFVSGDPGGNLDAGKLFREAHDSKAKPEDKVKQVSISFDKPADHTPFSVRLWTESVGGNQIVHVDRADGNVFTKPT